MLSELIFQRSHNHNKGMKYKTSKTIKQDFLLYLLKQPANMGMIISYTNCTEKSAKQMIYNLRKKGHIIKKNGEYYERQD